MTYLLHLLIIALILIYIMVTTGTADSYETKSVNRLNYGIYFKHVDTISYVNDNFLTTVKIPLPHREQLSNRASRPCSEHSAQNERAKLAYDQHLQFWHLHNALHEHADSRMQTLLDTITTLIPSKEMKNDQMTLHRQGEHLSSNMQLTNKRIDDLVTMIKQQQNDTANLLINMAFDW